jgi:signal transduction histidine kinase/CheY-like chemotaxis protein
MVFRNKSKQIAELKRKLVSLETENNRLNSLLRNVKGSDDLRSNTITLIKSIEINNIGFWIKYIDNDSVWLSLKAKEMLGIKNDNECSLEQLIAPILPEDKPDFERALNIIRPDGKLQELDLKIARTEFEGREFRLIHMIIICIADNSSNAGSPVILGSFRDITREDKVKRDLIKAKEKAEESERLKNILLTNISHEIRTPMNSIIGFSELLNLGNLPNEKRFEYVKIIKNQGILLRKMIDDMVELTKMESGKVIIRKSPCNIDLLLNELLLVSNQFKLAQNKENLDIRLDFPEKRSIITFTDQGRLLQLALNLVSNSIKYTEKGLIEIGYKAPAEQRIEFHIRASGTGLSRVSQKKIFSRLSEGELSAGKTEESGLDLTISKNLIRLLGGKIWIESEPDTGSVFYFTIPFEQVPETYHQIAPEEEYVIPSYTWKDKVILIVEDDEINYKFLEAVLQDTSVKLIHARNGLQAIELCKSINQIDLVLMDIKMPEMDGFEATRQIRKFNLNIPIIAQTAFVDEAEWDKFKDAGCNDQIIKPIEIKVFFEKIDNYLKEN